MKIKRDKKMFKKTLLAVAIAVVSTGAMAVDVSKTGLQKYGHEALTNGQVLNNGGELTIGADFAGAPTPDVLDTTTGVWEGGTASGGETVTLTLGAEYTQGDTITISLTGGKFVLTESFTLEQTNATASSSSEILLSNIRKSDTELVFRVTDKTGPTTGLVLVLDNGTFDINAGPAVGAQANHLILDSTAVGTKVTVSASAATSTGIPIDSTKTSSKVIGSVIQEHKYTVASAAAMAAKIDVAKARKEFSGVSGEEANFTVSYVRETPTQASFTPTSVKTTLNGSFAGFENSVATTDNDGTIISNPGGADGAATAAAPLTVAANLQSASNTRVFTPATGSSETFAFTVGTPAKRTVLNISNYTVDVLLSNSTTNRVNFSAIAAGSHTLNGANAQFAYVPVNFVGAVTSQFEIGNKGAVDGEITLSGFDSEGIKYSEILPFKAEANKLTKIGDDDIADAFNLTKGTKLNLTITVNAPASDITFGGYSNRGTTGRMSLQQVIVPSASSIP